MIQNIDRCSPLCIYTLSTPWPPHAHTLAKHPFPVCGDIKSTLFTDTARGRCSASVVRLHIGRVFRANRHQWVRTMSTHNSTYRPPISSIQTRANFWHKIFVRPIHTAENTTRPFASECTNKSRKQAVLMSVFAYRQLQGPLQRFPTAF